MKIFKYILQHKLVLFFIVCLLVIQAFCELSLPNFTSDIVDVGIQQGGIDNVSTTELSTKTHDFTAITLSKTDEDMFLSCYDLDNQKGHYVLNQKGFQNRDALDKIMTLPMASIQMLSNQKDMSIDIILKAYKTGLLTKESLVLKINEVRNQLGNLSDDIMNQQGIAAAKTEYQNLGIDINAIQMNYLIRTGIIMLVLTAIAMLVSILVGLLAARTGAKIGRKLRKKLFDRVVAFSSKEIDKFGAASLITRGTNDIQTIQMASILMLRLVIFAPIMAIGGIIMVAQHTLVLWWIIALAVIAVFILMAILFKVTGPKFKAMQRLIDKVNLVSREILTGIPVIRAFGREKYEAERFDDANINLTKTQLFTGRAMSFMIPVMTLIMNIVSVLIIWVGAHFVDAGNVQTGDLIAVITYSMLIVLSFLIIGIVAILLPRANVACERHDEVLACIPSINDPENPAINEALLHKKGVSVKFDNVSFSYGSNADKALDNINFEACEGKTTAIIGPTGSGKSTILRLIERFRDVDSGAVLIDGVDVRNMAQTQLRHLFGYVPQKAFLFDGTIDTNVCFSGNTDTKKRDKSIQIAQANEFVDSKDEGLDSAIYEGGSNVSGGQRQRLAIARALNTDAACYLFDDSFSALDYKTDALVREGLSKELIGKTSIIVAQRIATVMDADKIVVLNEGKVVGIGSHKDLLYNCQTYREIALSQFSSIELFGTDEVPPLNTPGKGGDNNASK